VCDVLVVAAFPPELAPLRPLLGDALRARIGEREVIAKAVGIGLPTAAAGTAARLIALRPKQVVLVGTCGAFGGAIANGGVAIAQRVVLAEPAVARNEAAYPEPMSVEATADPALARAIARHGGTLADVATTLAVTTSDALAADLARTTRCQAEHLEAHGVAAACAAESVPFAAVLGVANAVGGTGRAEWRANHRSAAAAAIEVLVAWLKAGASG
jgi:nucleoside phosphorylase